MIDGAGAVADGRRVADGSADVVLRSLRGLREILAERQTCGDGGRERTARAVSVTTLDSRRAKFVEPVPVEEHVDDFRTTSMSPCYHDRRRAHSVEPSR